METAFGKMQIRPDDFWNMSLPEFFAAINGFSEFHSSGQPPLRKNDLVDLMEMYPD